MTTSKAHYLVLLERRNLAPFHPELVAEPLGFADALELERHGIHRLLEVLDSLFGQLCARQMILLRAPRRASRHPTYPARPRRSSKRCSIACISSRMAQAYTKPATLMNA